MVVMIINNFQFTCRGKKVNLIALSKLFLVHSFKNLRLMHILKTTCEFEDHDGFY